MFGVPATRTGEPGPAYWQQRDEYRLEAELNQVSKRLNGRGTDHLSQQLASTRCRPSTSRPYGNLFAPDAEAEYAGAGLAWWDHLQQGGGGRAGAGLELARGRMDGERVRSMALTLPKPLLPGTSVELEFAWNLRIPPDGPRGGQDRETYVLSYWYSQVAVYDDVNGWQIDQYLGNAEFYMGYGDYDVALTVPEGWLVASTGTLQNPEDVLSDTTRARLAPAPRRWRGGEHCVRQRARCGEGHAEGEGRQAHVALQGRERP